MTKRAIFTTWLVVCAALPALTAELEFSANGEVEYDDNVFRSNTDEEEDVLFRVYPGVRVHEDRGDDLNFSLGYTAPVEFSIDNSDELNEVDHIGNGNFDYRVNERVSLFGSDRYGYIRSTLRQQGVDTGEQPLQTGFSQFTDARDRIKVNNATLGAAYRFSPRTVARAIASSSFFDSSRSDRAQVWSVSGTADALYKLTLKHQVGGGAGYTFQNFDDRQDISGSQTQTYRVFGSWRWLVSETLAFDLSVGPAYLETEQDDASRLRFVERVPFTVLPALSASQLNALGFVDKNNGTFTSSTGAGSLLVANSNSCTTIDGVAVAVGCVGNIVIDSTTDAATVGAVLGDSIPVTNGNPGGESDTEVTGFVEAVLTQRWTPTLASALRYSRQQGDASGVGGTAIDDGVSLSNTWAFAERWQLAVRGDWVRRESAFDIAQTFDVVTAQQLPGGSLILVATRNGDSFNSTRDVQIDTDTWGVSGQITHQLFRTTSLYARVRYSEQDSRSDTLGNASDFENFLATFGVRHVFEPIPLW